MSLNTFSDNWNDNDAGTFIWVSTLNLGLNGQLCEKVNLENSCDLSFGQIKVQDKTTKKWSAPEKSSDNINLLTVLRFNLRRFIDPFVSINLWSEFLDNRNSSKVIYLNPALITESMGISRNFVDKTHFTWDARFGCTLRQNYDRGVLVSGDSITPEKYKTEIVVDGGSELVSTFNYNRGDILTISGKLSIYNAFFSSEAQKLAQNDFWRYPDINFESTFSFYLTHNLIFSYYCNLAYDREYDKKPRFKQTLGAGLGFSITGNR